MFQIGRHNGQCLDGNASVQEGRKGEIATIADLNAARGDGLIHVGASGEGLKFGLKASFRQKIHFRQNHVNSVLPREWPLPAEGKRPPAFFFQPAYRLFRNFLVWLRPTPLGESLWLGQSCARKSSHGRDSAGASKRL